MSTEIHALGEDIRKERTEIAELFSNATDLTAEKVAEVRTREASLAEKQSRFDTLFEADRIERENKGHLDRIGQVKRPVEPEQIGAARPAPRPFAEIVGPNIAKARGFSASEHKTVELGTFTGTEAARLMPEIKTLFQLSNAPQEDERLTRIAFDEQEERSLVNLPAPGTMSQEVLSYLEETTFTNNAVETAEGSALGEAAFSFTERNVSARWLGTFVPVTEQSLSDIDFLESYLRGRLGFQVAQRVASQLLNGNNVAPNIGGYGTIVTQTQAKGADPVFDAIYKGMVRCRVTGFAEPDAIVMHPNDWQDIRLTRTADGIYILGNPADRGAETLFGLPVHQTTHQTENTALTGAFRAHSQFFVREGISLAATNAHASFFIEGKVAIRATMRAALAVYRPLALCKITGV